MFRDRADGGKQLSRLLGSYRGRKCTVYALPRGGLPVGFEVARSLGVPLDVLIVKKIGAPYQEELAMGAVTEGEPPTFHYNKDIIHALGVPEESVRAVAEGKIAEIERIRHHYRDGDELVVDPGRTAIIVDDGIATGATVKAAVKFFREHGSAAVVVAVPVAHTTVLDEIRSMADEVYCVDEVRYMEAVGQFYENFREISHEDAAALLKTAARMLRDA